MQHKVPESNPRINYEWKTMKNIKQKQINHNLTVIRVDKGKTLVTNTETNI
jgi:hypothetical protein